MNEPINLNKARKAKAKASATAKAQENRVRFGRTGAQKAASRLEEARAVRALDGVKRED